MVSAPAPAPGRAEVELTRAALGRVRPAVAIAAFVTLASVAGTLPAVAVPPAEIVFDGPSDRRVVALTIDDGYSEETCLRMAAILRRRGATATFFPVGSNVAGHPGVWRSIGRDFPIANHTANHALLTHLGPVAIVEQVRRARRILERVVPDAAVPEFRAPGGALSRQVRRILTTEGYTRTLLWDATNADTDLDASVGAMVRAGLRGGPGSIVLMHCNRPISASALEGIISGYRVRGYRFVTIRELLGPPPARPRPGGAQHR